MGKLTWLCGICLGVALILSLSVHAADAPANASKDPMPLFAPGYRILFQGDSITDGNRDRKGDATEYKTVADGVRKQNADLNHIIGHGYQALISARFGADLAERNLLFINRGNSGDTVRGLQRRMQSDIIDLKPDVLSILIGVNDLGGRGNVSADQAAQEATAWEQQYDALLSDITKALPNVKLILAEPFGLPVGAKKAIWDNYLPQLVLRQAVVAHLAAKYHAPVIHYQKMFDDAVKRAPADYWIWDGVHPTVAGHQLMADEWVKTVNAFYPTAPTTPPAVK